MGLLDPQIDKERTFELLRKRGAVRAELLFSGGHDEGDVYSIILTFPNETTKDLEVWYCGGYTMGPDGLAGGWIPCSTPANEDEELSDLLQGPVNEEFGSWGSVESTSGTLVWDVEAGTARMNYVQDAPADHHKVW
jgi:hypothetical protein